MNLSLSYDNMDEYLVVAGISCAVCLAGIFSVVVQNDGVIILATTVILFAVLYFLEEVQPIYLLYALCFGVSFLPYVNLQIFPLSGVYIVGLLFLLASVISYFRSEDKVRISRQAKWLLLFFTLAVVSILWAPDKKGAVIYSGQFFVYISIYIAAVYVFSNKKQIVRALQYVLLGSIIPIVFSLCQLVVSFGSLKAVIDNFYHAFLGKLFIGTKGLERIGEDVVNILNRGSNVAEASDFVLFRVFGTFEGPTSFGVFMLLLALLAGGLYIGQWNKKRVVLTAIPNVLLFAVISVCLFFTWTRSAVLAFVIALVFMILFRRTRHIQLFSRKNLIFALLIFVIPFLILFFLTNVFSLRTLGGSTAARLLTIIFSLVYIYNNPIIGIGIGNYALAQPGTNAEAGEASLASAHNTYLELGVELGLPGIILFLVILFSFVKQAGLLMQARRKSFYHTLGLLFTAIWIGFAISSFFGGSLIHPRLMTLMWILAGIQTASYYLYLNDKKKEDTIYRLEATD